MENERPTETPEAEESASQHATPEPEKRAPGADMDLVMDVPLKLTVEIGNAKLMVRDLLQLGKGSIVELDRMSGDPADVYVNDRLVARGEVTVVEERLAVRIVEVVGSERWLRDRH
ncbi:MAG: flagellar motor switch protein FliN [Proteobacteria bacterium]|nr:flagellar motor switch protein FliN [Pseudomonadota bacterium]